MTRLSRRGFLGAAAASCFGAGSAPPNFLVLFCDDLGYGDLGCFGSPAIRTPHLDRLAEEGVRFTSCYASAPVCSPSRGGLLTGRTPYRLGITDWIPAGSPMHLRRGEITVAALLRQAGYATALVGKWHLNGLFNSPDQPQPGDHGFDHWFATQNNAAPSHRDPDNFVRNGKPAGKLEGFSCDLIVDEAIRWLDGPAAGRPFFLHVCFHEPHEPIDSPEALVEQYPGARKRGEALHYANVANLDQAAGRLLAALDRRNLAANTLVFFSSDNGPETLNRYPGAWRSHGSPGPFRGMKLHLYEGGIRVPGMLRWPGRAAPGQICDEPVCHTDLLPAFCEAAGVAPPRGRAIDGVSLLPLLSGLPLRRERPIYWEYGRALGAPKAAIREGDWKLLAHGDGKTFELYHLRADLTERHNLAEREPERVRKMAAALLEMRRQVHADAARE